MDVDVKALTEATAGALGGVVSTTILYPLDTCKTKFQAEANADGTKKYRSLVDVLREAVACGKVLSLYQGLATKNGHAVLSGFVYFYSYSYIRSKYLDFAGVSRMGTLANLVVAAAAGACTCCVTQPLDTLSARMQTSKPGEAKGLLQLLREEGVFHAYDGLGISLILTVNPAIQYTVFEQLKMRVLDRQQRKLALSSSARLPPPALSAFAAFVIGAISKCTATLITYPLIRCKVMMQRAVTAEEEEQRKLGGRQACAVGPPTSMARAFQIIWHSEGVPGLYKGLRAQILKTVLSAALMLMIKEKVSEGSRAAVLSLHRLLTSGKLLASSQEVSPKVSVPLPPSSVSSLSGALPEAVGVTAPSGSRVQPPSSFTGLHPVRVIPVQVNRHGRGGSVQVFATDEGTV